MQGLCLKDNQNEAPRKAYGNCKLRIIKVTIDYLVQLSIALHLALHLQASNRDKKSIPQGIPQSNTPYILLL